MRGFLDGVAEVLLNPITFPTVIIIGAVSALIWMFISVAEVEMQCHELGLDRDGQGCIDPTTRCSIEPGDGSAPLCKSKRNSSP